MLAMPDVSKVPVFCGAALGSSGLRCRSFHWWTSVGILDRSVATSCVIHW